MVNIHQAKTQLSKLVEAAASGQEIVIAKAGKPVAKLVPLSHGRAKRKLGRLKGKLRASKNFDAPLPTATVCAFDA